METLRYEDFSLGLHQGAVAQRIPLTGTIEVTRRWLPLESRTVWSVAAIFH